MSMFPHLIEFHHSRQGKRLGDFRVIDYLVHDGLIDALNHYYMGITAKNVAQKFNISRMEQDEFAYNSQKKAIQSIEKSIFKDEIVAVEIIDKKVKKKFCEDGYHCRTTNLNILSGLKPAFKSEAEGGMVLLKILMGLMMEMVVFF